MYGFLCFWNIMHMKWYALQVTSSQILDLNSGTSQKEMDKCGLCIYKEAYEYLMTSVGRRYEFACLNKKHTTRRERVIYTSSSGMFSLCVKFCLSNHKSVHEILIYSLSAACAAVILWLPVLRSAAYLCQISGKSSIIHKVSSPSCFSYERVAWRSGATELGTGNWSRSVEVLN